MYEVGIKGEKKKKKTYVNTLRCGNCQEYARLYIYIYISASQQKARYSLTRQMGGHSMYTSKFFFFSWTPQGRQKRSGWKIKNERKKKRAHTTNHCVKNRHTWYTRGATKNCQQQGATIHLWQLTTFHFFFLRMKTANTVVWGVGKLTIQGCDYLQNSIKTVQKKKGVIKEQLWSKPRLSFYEKLPMPSHEQSRSSSNRQVQWSLLPTVCKALLTLRPSCNLVT